MPTFVGEVEGLVHVDIADLGRRLSHRDGALVMLVGTVAGTEHGALERIDNLGVLIGLNGQLLDRVLKLIEWVLANGIAASFFGKSDTALAGGSALHISARRFSLQPYPPPFLKWNWVPASFAKPIPHLHPGPHIPEAQIPSSTQPNLNKSAELGYKSTSNTWARWCHHTW
jgi:hypothetical protein